MTRLAASTCSPGSHPHEDRPNWRRAETIDEYVNNCREGLEQYSDRRAAKLFGVSRAKLWRMQLMAEIPEDLFDRLLQLRPVPSTKALALIAQAPGARTAAASCGCASASARRPSR